MRQPSPSSQDSPALPAPRPPVSTTPAPTATEIVTRPDPGIARGKWEAPVWMFWAILGVVVLGAAAYTLRRLGMLQLGKKPAGNQDAAPPSSKMRRP